MSRLAIETWDPNTPVTPGVEPYVACRWCGAPAKPLSGPSITGAAWAHKPDCYAAWMVSGPKPIWLAWQAAGCPLGWDPQTGPPW